VFWSTIINVEFDVYKNVVKEKVSNPLVPDEPASPLRGLGIGLPPLADGVGGGYGGIGSASAFGGSANEYVRRGTGLLSGAFDFETERVECGEGRDEFEVVWSVTVSSKNNLSRPKIEYISHLGTHFQPLPLGTGRWAKVV